MRALRMGWGNRLLRAALLVLALVCAGPAEAAPRWGKDYLPNVEVLDQDGTPRHFYDDLLKGRITVISFVYTSCNSICPLAISRLAEVQEKLSDVMGRQIHFLSISIDPIPDTPEKLKEHATAFGVGPGWSFITGEPANIDLVRYKLGERSGKSISQHKNEVLLYNDLTGEWARDSAFSDIDVLALTIRAMDPKARAAVSSAPPAPLPEMLHHGALDAPGQALFVKACASCHSVGGGTKVGPDLAGLTARRSRDWITAYLTGPERLRKAGDPIAVELRLQFPNVRMPNLSLSEDDVSDLIAYVESARAGAGDTEVE